MKEIAKLTTEEKELMNVDIDLIRTEIKEKYDQLDEMNYFGIEIPEDFKIRLNLLDNVNFLRRYE